MPARLSGHSCTGPITAIFIRISPLDTVLPAFCKLASSRDMKPKPSLKSLTHEI